MDPKVARMPRPFLPLAVSVLTLLFAGCASRPLPKYEKPMARAQFQTVRTTAYTHTESDHKAYSNRNALGTCLQCGPVHSAAADWSRWPAGTTFRLLNTGELFRVDDYGWALSGTNTIDLYKPTRHAMNTWGVRRVNIEVLNWGDVDRSLAVLKPRAKHPHIKRMIQQIKSRYASLKKPVPTVAKAQPAAPAAVAVGAPEQGASRQLASVRPSVSNSLLTPFSARDTRP